MKQPHQFCVVSKMSHTLRVPDLVPLFPLPRWPYHQNFHPPSEPTSNCHLLQEASPSPLRIKVCVPLTTSCIGRSKNYTGLSGFLEGYGPSNKIIKLPNSGLKKILNFLSFTSLASEERIPSVNSLRS